MTKGWPIVEQLLYTLFWEKDLVTAGKPSTKYHNQLLHRHSFEILGSLSEKKLQNYSLWLWVFVCVYKYMHAAMYTYGHIYAHTFMHICAFVFCMWKCVCCWHMYVVYGVCMILCVLVYVQTYAVCLSMHTPTRAPYWEARLNHSH